MAWKLLKLIKCSVNVIFVCLVFKNTSCILKKKLYSFKLQLCSNVDEKLCIDVLHLPYLPPFLAKKI